MNAFYVWLLGSLGTCGSYLLVWLLAYVFASGVSEGDPVIKAFKAWFGILLIHAVIVFIFTAPWLIAWFGLVKVSGIWASLLFPVLGVVCLIIDIIALCLIARDRRTFEVIALRR